MEPPFHKTKCISLNIVLQNNIVLSELHQLIYIRGFPYICDTSPIFLGCHTSGVSELCILSGAVRGGGEVMGLSHVHYVGVSHS